MNVRTISAGWLLVLLLAVAIPIGAQEPEGKQGSPWLGIIIGPQREGGILVVAVTPGGPASGAGLREGDVLVSLAGTAVPDRARLGEAVAGLRTGEPVEAVLRRGGEELVKTLVPADRTRRSSAWLRGRQAEDWPLTLSDPGISASGLGLQVAEISPELRIHYGAPEQAGVLVIGVDEGSVAAAGGLRVGDVVVRVGGMEITGPVELEVALMRNRDAGSLGLHFIRGRQPMQQEIDLPPAGRVVRVVPPPGDPAAVPPVGSAVSERERIRAMEREIRELRQRIRMLEEQLREARRER